MLFGHEDKIKAFKKLIGEGKLSHAYLFYGDAQIGKFSFAKSLGSFLESKNFQLSEEPLIDAKIFSPADSAGKPNDMGTIGIDAVRGIKHFLWQTPFRSPKKLAIIDEAQALTREAQGALLKIVEEPPPHGLLIFIASNLEIFSPPLLSRLIKIYFRRLPDEKLEKILIENFNAAPAKAKTIAENSFGRIGLALGLLNGGKTNEAEDNLENDLENEILALRKRDIFKNAVLIAWLLEKESALKKYNLNKNLQKKAIETKLYKS